MIQSNKTFLSCTLAAAVMRKLIHVEHTADKKRIMFYSKANLVSKSFSWPECLMLVTVKCVTYCHLSKTDEWNSVPARRESCAYIENSESSMASIYRTGFRFIHHMDPDECPNIRNCQVSLLLLTEVSSFITQPFECVI